MPQSLSADDRCDAANRVVIDLTALADNYRVIRQLAGKADILAMVKSDAYGHGLVRCALELSRVGAAHFGVAEPAEGVVLREAGIDGEIIIFLGGVDPEPLIRYNLTPVVFDLENIRAISAAAVAHNSRVGLHLKVDVGMGRLGIMPDELPGYVAEIVRLPGVFLAGILSHFPKADQEASLTGKQNARFLQLINALADNPAGGIKPNCIHIANSAALMQYPETCQQMVRPGISLYGCYPAGDRARYTAGVCAALRPVMTFKTRVLQVKDVPAGYGISYGHLFKTGRPSRLAVLPVGYADGYLRSLTGRASVLIHGRRAPVCGRICMNACVVDVTDIPAAGVGDEVVLVGRQLEAEITVDEVAGWMNTINYEVLCLFGNNNARKYL